MRTLACALLLLVACKKSEPAKTEPAKSVEPASAPSATGSAPAPAPTPAPPTPSPTPAPPPAPADPYDAAVAAATDVFTAVAPVTKEWGDKGKDCATKGIPEVDKVLETKKAQLEIVKQVHKDADASSRFYKTFFNQGDLPLHDAKSAALGAALHCAKLHDHILVAMGFPPMMEPATKKKK